MKNILIIIILIIPTLGHCQMGQSYPYYLKSQNGEYYLKSIPHRDQLHDISGRTDVFKSSDSTLLYSINKYFAPHAIAFNNNGTSILQVYYSNYKYNDLEDGVMFLYKNGKMEKSYTLGQIILKKPDKPIYKLFYRNYDLYKWDTSDIVFHDTVKTFMQNISKNPLFSNDSLAFLATSLDELLEINLNNGEILNRYNLEQSEEIVNTNFSYQEYIVPEYHKPPIYSIPNLMDGTKFEEAFAREFGYKCDSAGERSYRYRYHILDLTCLIDNKGNCVKVYSNFEDSTMNGEIEEYFLGVKFDSTVVPSILEKWHFQDFLYYRNPNNEIAIKERMEERRQEYDEKLWRTKQDTLKGIYIPKDLYDCFNELDKFLSEDSKEKIKKSDHAKYHFGLGTKLRNSWGLWTSSRLSKYFNDKGVTHPDSMSGIILRTYKQYLNNDTVIIEDVFNLYPVTPKPELLLPAWMKADSSSF